MILLDVSGASAIVRKQDILTSGMVGAKVVFCFDEDWDNLAKTAVFRAGKVTKDAIVVDSISEIPHEVLAAPGVPLEIGVYPITLVYELATIVETALSDAEIAAYNALRTYKDYTIISNDAWAYMELQYAMDVKKYIDSQIVPETKVTSISLLASKWVGSGSLYSQVVTIDGVTENSQVNLTPSVEQLSIFYDKDLTFSTENDGGVVTVYVIGQKPQNNYTIQADIVEVIV